MISSLLKDRDQRCGDLPGLALSDSDDEIQPLHLNVRNPEATWLFDNLLPCTNSSVVIAPLAIKDFRTSFALAGLIKPSRQFQPSSSGCGSTMLLARLDSERIIAKGPLRCITYVYSSFYNCATVYMPDAFCSFYRQGDEWMSGPSNLVGVRLPDDDLALLDQHVGTGGMRNRSDVIRRSLRLLFDNQPSLPSMKKVVVELGTAQQFQLAHLQEMMGVTPEAAITTALNNHLEQMIAKLTAQNEQYESTAAELRERVTRKKEFEQ